MKVVWSPLSLDQFTDYAERITNDKPSAVEEWVDSIFSSTDKLVYNPEIGRSVP